MIIDGKDLVLGRLAVFAAKKAILGETVQILNCEQVIVTGKKELVLREFRESINRGHPLKGPYYPRHPHLIVKRAIRGMLPYKTARGKEMFKRVICYNGIPEDFKDKKAEAVESAKVKTPKIPSVKLGEVGRLLGAKF